MKIKHLYTSIYALISLLGLLGLFYTVGNVVMPYYVAPLNFTIGSLKRGMAQGPMDPKAISEVISEAEKARTSYYLMLSERNYVTGVLSTLLILTSSVCAYASFKKNKRPNQAPLPTPMSVTDRADARSAPATGAAEL